MAECSLNNQASFWYVYVHKSVCLLLFWSQAALNQLELDNVPRDHKNCVVVFETINASLEGGLLLEILVMGLLTLHQRIVSGFTKTIRYLHQPISN